MDKKILWFIGSVLLLSWASVFSIKFFNLSQSPLTVVMVFPMLLALLFMFFSREDRFSEIGWEIPRWTFFIICIFLPIFLVGLTLAANHALGLISYNSLHLITKKPTSNVWLNLVLCLPGMFIPFILLSIPSFVIGWLNHLGEEVAWRGYLFRKIAKDKESLLPGIIVSGSVWWAWHVPMFWLSPVLMGLNIWQMGLTIILSFFALLGTATVYSWIYVKSGSIWAPTIMHLFWNLYRGVLTGRMADGEPGLFRGNIWLINGEGIVGNGITILISLFFLYLIIKLDKTRAAKLKLPVFFADRAEEMAAPLEKNNSGR